MSKAMTPFLVGLYKGAHEMAAIIFGLAGSVAADAVQTAAPVVQSPCAGLAKFQWLINALVAAIASLSYKQFQEQRTRRRAARKRAEKSVKGQGL